MPTTEAQIAANKANAARSSGPKTAEGKAQSRGNALKHGLTGAGIALPVEDAAEVDRLHRSFEAEMKPSGDLSRTLVRRLALLAVRMDRCAAHETAALTERIYEAEAEFDAEWPEVEGEVNLDRDRARLDVAHLAMFDPGKEATLARKYEAAAERGFFRSLKELRLVEKQAKAAGNGLQNGSKASQLGSFLPAVIKPSASPSIAASTARTGSPVIAKPVAPAPKPVAKPFPSLPLAPKLPFAGTFDVPFAIGRAG